MHGVKRTKVSPEAAEAKRSKESGKIQAYSTSEEDVLARKKAKDYSPEASKKTTESLDSNPEFYTVWNYRRHILTRGSFPNSKPEEIVALLGADLRSTVAYLKVHPKVYWIWTHRMWCLENIPRGPGDTEGWRNEMWKVEFGLVEKSLESDARNFHAWGYRRYISRSSPETAEKRTPQDELKYTTRKIEASFSNFSAWHYRTKLLGKMFEDMTPEQIAEKKDEEFELVTQALWTEPADQSGWSYHRWLVGQQPSKEVLDRELSSIKESHEAEPDSKWCMNASAHYLLLSASSGYGEDEQREEAKKLLARLETIDADRKERYRELSSQYE